MTQKSCAYSLGALLLLVVSTAYSQTVYKYQTPDGRWHFTDKPPAAERSESIEIKARSEAELAPKVRQRFVEGKQQLVAVNPWFGPVQFSVAIRSDRYDYIRTIVAGRDEEIMLSRFGAKPYDFEFRWIPGHPEAEHQAVVYSPPLKKGDQYKVSQGFKGKFSHNRQPSLYAIDIAMPFGTPVHAARSGKIMAISDRFVIGSAQWAYFYDKANYVMVLHNDGTIAIYAHLLQGSIQVQPGSSVERGDFLAKSGNSGFSTGPHLHFAVRKNAGGKLHSVPFRMESSEGKPYQLNRGEMLTGW